MKSKIMSLTGAVISGLVLATSCGVAVSARHEAVKDLYSLDNEGRITISKVIETYGLPAEDAFNTVKNLIEGNLLDAEYKIVSEDAVSRKFTASGHYDAIYNRLSSSISKLGCHVDSRFNLEARDGRIKATVTILNYRNDAINVDARTVWPFNKKDKRNRNITGVYSIAEPVTVPKSHASKYFNAAVTNAEALLSQIESKFKQDKAEEDW